MWTATIPAAAAGTTSLSIQPPEEGRRRLLDPERMRGGRVIHLEPEAGDERFDLPPDVAR
jgi:hypothetical protein